MILYRDALQWTIVAIIFIHGQGFIVEFLFLFSHFFVIRTSINKWQRVKNQHKGFRRRIYRTHICDSLDVSLLDMTLKVFIEHCQLYTFHRDGHNVCVYIYIWPFYMCYHRCEILDLNIIFQNVKLRILLIYILWISVLNYCTNLILSTVQSAFKWICLCFLIPFYLKHILNTVFSFSKSCLIDMKHLLFIYLNFKTQKGKVRSPKLKLATVSSMHFTSEDI